MKTVTDPGRASETIRLAGVVAQVWAQALQVPELGFDADVFARGADSIRVFQVTERLTALGHQCDAQQVFRAPTPYALARALLENRRAPELHGAEEEPDERAVAAMVRLDLSDADDDLDSDPRELPWPQRRLESLLLCGANGPLRTAVLSVIAERSGAMVHVIESAAEAASAPIAQDASAGVFDAVVQLAADSVGEGTYAQTRGAVVHATRDLLEVAKHAGADFIFLSDTAALDPARRGAHLGRWVAEHLVTAAGTSAIRTVIVRRGAVPDDELGAAIVSSILDSDLDAPGRPQRY